MALGVYTYASKLAQHLTYKGLVQAVHVIKTASPKSLFNGQLDNRLRLLVCGIIML